MTAGVVKSEGSFGGLGISPGFVQGLGVIHLVVLHLWVQLRELLVAFCSGAEILDVVVAVTQQRQRCPGLESTKGSGECDAIFNKSEDFACKSHKP